MTYPQLIHIDLGGPTYYIDVAGKRRPFEMHPYCGPNLLNARTGDPLTNMPAAFWDAIERWQLGGKRVEGEDAVLPQWCPACEGIGEELKHLGGKHYQIVGPCKVCNGTKITPIEPAG